jgi:hypothetical protein
MIILFFVLGHLAIVAHGVPPRRVSAVGTVGGPTLL